MQRSVNHQDYSDMSRKLKKQDVQEEDSNIGCIILLVAFVLFLVVVALLSRKWDKDEAYAKELVVMGDSCFKNNDLAAAIKYYVEAFDTYEIDTLASTLMKCEYWSGNPNKTLEWLDKIGEMRFHSDFIEIHRNQTLFSMTGDTARYVSVLDSLIFEQISLKKVSGIRRIWDLVMNNDINYTQKENYDRYYFNYYAKLLALHYRFGMCRSYDEFVSTGAYLFNLVEDQEDDYEYMDDFLNMGGNSSISNVLKEHEKLVMNTTQGHQTMTYMDRVSNYKWWMFNILVTYVHQMKGYEVALDYANKITDNNKLNADSNYSYNKFLYGIYSGVNDKNAFPTSLTRCELDAILEYSSGHNGYIPNAQAVVVTGGYNFLTRHKYSIDEFRQSGDIVYEPIVIIESDTWNWKEQCVPFLAKDEGVNLSYISDTYKASDSNVCFDFFQVRLTPVMSTLYVMNLLQAEYNKQKGPPVYSSIVDFKSLSSAL